MISQSFKMAWKSISGNKVRSFLTMLGIIIGVTSLVVLVSVVSSATAAVNESFSRMMKNMLIVSIYDDKDNPYRLEELLELGEEDAVKLVAPEAYWNATGKKETTSKSLEVTGTTADYFAIQGLELERGRFLNAADLQNNTYTAVINQDVALGLFGHSDVLGETFSMNGTQITVVGVLKAEDNVFFDYGWEWLQVYIPFTTLMRMAEDVSSINQFYVTSTELDNLADAELAVGLKLLDRLKGDAQAFSIYNEADALEEMENVDKIMAYMLGAIAAISLVVGGIGIMNIMLVSVTERTKEIGIRKAVGATYGNIMSQFLIEAVLISLIGCGIGILFSWGIVELLGMAMTEYKLSLSVEVIWIATLFSAFIGIVFGIYPANKASRMNPIDALRF